jgi:hypothetical protein
MIDLVYTPIVPAEQRDRQPDGSARKLELETRLQKLEKHRTRLLADLTRGDGSEPLRQMQHRELDQAKTRIDRIRIALGARP